MGKKKQAIILGAGISGLSLAYFLSKEKNLDVAVLEKSSRPGGWLHTERRQGFHFETGPRTFKASRSLALLELVDELGLNGELIHSAKEAEKRYLWREGKLRKAPDFFLVKELFYALLNEWRAPRGPSDESIWAFAERRFGLKVAQYLFDPLTTGIYAGDSKTLSIRSCFPGMKAWEETYGSLTKGLFASPKNKKIPGLLSFRTGVGRLIQALAERSGAPIHFNQEARKLHFTQTGVEVSTEDKIWSGDFLFSALPSAALGHLLLPHDAESGNILLGIQSESLAVVNLGYKERKLSFKGFGYLVPSCEGEKILGAVFDSEVFPQHNNDLSETRLTVMTKDLEGSLKTALDGVKKHLMINGEPDAYSVNHCVEAIPQFGVGHAERIAVLESRINEKLPLLKLVGNYLHGVSVNDCVTKAKGAAQAWKIRES